MLVLIPFNYLGATIVGIPLRPAALLPVTLGILFGPAAAWGLGIGNIAGDFFGGSWSAMSIIGFFINMLIPYLSLFPGNFPTFPRSIPQTEKQKQ